MKDRKLPYQELITANKPMRTDCTCFEDDVVFAGRFGTWRKGVLTHDGYRAVKEKINK